ncbi:hypothetical protein [Sphaerotilus montanus]|uniref:Uncharacterized protein n=1 Tax=Sphaerotilus montanus TaxID=522889 RepID=A0A7Y9R135_9BURK|nr:hypothetical protein [Sphaerotilus montanus]NYG35260.1 hypothetical protein [Sphaerotilus montanus]
MRLPTISSADSAQPMADDATALGHAGLDVDLLDCVGVFVVDA